MTRFPSDRQALPASLHATFDAIAGRRGTVPAPYLPLLASPEVAERFEQFSARLWGGRLGRDVQELVFLVTAQAWGCRHQWVTHEPKALAAGIGAPVIDALRAGRDIGGLAEGPRLLAAARVARRLQMRQPLDDELFTEMTQAFDAAEVSELLAFCALAASIAMLLNANERTETA